MFEKNTKFKRTVNNLKFTLSKNFQKYNTLKKVITFQINTKKRKKY